MSLDHYLRPFDVNIKTRYEKHAEEFIEIQQDPSEDASDNELECENEPAPSEISTVPSSLYSTPRISLQHFLPNVDLTLRSTVKKSDIKSYLIEIFSQSNEQIYNNFLN